MSPQSLSWQPGYSLSRKPRKRPAPCRKNKGQFQFVPECLFPEARLVGGSSLIGSAYLGAHSRTPNEPPHVHDNAQFYRESEVAEFGSVEVSEFRMLDDASAVRAQSWPSESEDSGDLSKHLPDIGNRELKFTPSSMLSTTHSEQMAALCNGRGLDMAVYVKHSIQGFCPVSRSNGLPREGNPTYSLETSLPPAVAYSSLVEKFKPILNRYNGEFCAIPLTFDLRVNPFEYRNDLDPKPAFLVHAVLALAGHHVGSSSTLSHHQTALVLLRNSLSAFTNAETIHSMLDTIIILFSLGVSEEETQSLLGSWTPHLRGAYGLLEACGGISGIIKSSRTEIQIAMMIWWDAIINLISREECVFPYAYFEMLLSNECRREWDFFGLCGCPTGLVKVLMQVTRLRVRWRGSPMNEDLSVEDDDTISSIEERLKDWQVIPPLNATQSGEHLQRVRDTASCSEAWRLGLILYVFRRFRWRPGFAVPIQILRHATVIVEQVISCCNNHMISKQALLPLFFAGCEIRDPSMRREIVRKCIIWDQMTRYHLFRNTIPLLEKVWAEQESKGFDNVWWGHVVDLQHMDASCPLPMRICFG